MTALLTSLFYSLQSITLDGTLVMSDARSIKNKAIYVKSDSDLSAFGWLSGDRGDGFLALPLPIWGENCFQFLHKQIIVSIIKSRWILGETKVYVLLYCFFLVKPRHRAPGHIEISPIESKICFVIVEGILKFFYILAIKKSSV